MERWKPTVACRPQEQRLLTLAGKSRKLFVFLREHRHDLFDDSFQDELETMYRQTGQGETPQPPALMCMGLLLQAYLQTSDAEAVRLSASDRCWRMVLGTLDADEDEPAFSQGGLQQFRDRLIACDMDRRLLERTVEVAKATKGFDVKKTPKSLRVGVDSRPLEGAGRVEDTINLLGHAGRKIAECIALTLGTDVEEVCQQADVPLLMASSIKAGLDIDWSAPDAKANALNRLCRQLDRLTTWVAKQPTNSIDAPLSRYIEALAQVQEQDLEPRAEGGVQIRQGVAADRRISIEDAEMRHGRKSKSKRFNGYKQHISTDLDTDLVLSCAVTPANRPEEEATAALQEDMARLELFPDELFIDRAYLNSVLTEDVAESGGLILCKPWRGAGAKPGLFGKRDFKVNVRDGTITCPAGEVEAFEHGAVVHFDPEACGPCSRVRNDR
jgi:Transposase domain (DUF772)/Transposase DDE domain